MKTIPSEDFEALVIHPAYPVVVDFYADWCGPCQMMTPVLEQLERDNGDFAFYRVNAGDSHELTVRYGVFTLPTVVFFKNGRAVAQSIGLKPAEELQKILNGMI